MCAKKVAQVDVKVTGSKSIQDIENELAKVNEELKTMDVNSQAFAEMAQQSQALEGELQGVNQQLSYISPAEQADGFLKMGEGILGSVAAVQGLSAAFGTNNEEMEETIKKLVGLVAAMDGIRKVSEALQRENLAKLERGFQSVGNVARTSFRAVGRGLDNVSRSMTGLGKATTKGAKVVNTAFKSIIIIAVITAIVVAIKSLYDNWDKVLELFGKDTALKDVGDRLEKMTEQVEDLSDELIGLGADLEDMNNRIAEIGTIDVFDLNRLFQNEEAFDRIKDLITGINDLKIQSSRVDSNSVEGLRLQERLLSAQAELQQQLIKDAKTKYENLKDEYDVQELSADLLKLEVELNGQIGEEGERITGGLKEQYNISKDNLDNLTQELKNKKLIKDVTWEQIEGVGALYKGLEGVNEEELKSIESIERNIDLTKLNADEQEKLNTYLELELDERIAIEEFARKVHEDANEQIEKNYNTNKRYWNAEMEFHEQKTALTRRIGKNQIDRLEEQIEKEKEAFEITKTGYDNLEEKIKDIKSVLEQLILQPQVTDLIVGLGKINSELKNTQVDLMKALTPIVEEIKPIEIELDAKVTLDETDIKDVTISPEINTTNWDTFVMNAKMDIGELKESTEDWGGTISDFSNEYLIPLGQEFTNIIYASADLFAAEQEQVIALAELKIEKNQEIIDDAVSEQERLQELMRENNDEILDYEDLLKDANAERYTEIQQHIEEEKAANAELAEQEEIQKQKELKAEKEKAKAEYEIALAEWEIKKSDLEANQIAAGVNGALAVINALGAPFPLNIVLPILIGLATAVQIASINKQIGTLDKTKPKPPKAAKGMLVGPSHEGGGIPIEAEGGEFIVNKRATSEYLPLIQAINDSGNRPKYAEGGQVTQPAQTQNTAVLDYDLLALKISESIRPVVSVVEITEKQNAVKAVQQNAGI
jgi:hypothetical protein